MLDDTLVIWGGEFGRTPMGQGTGRDHHILGFSLWMAGGGIKGGMTYGATDELGYKAVENVVHVRDLHATILAPLRHRPRAAVVTSSRASTSASPASSRRGSSRNCWREAEDGGRAA